MQVLDTHLKKKTFRSDYGPLTTSILTRKVFHSNLIVIQDVFKTIITSTNLALDMLTHFDSEKII